MSCKFPRQAIQLRRAAPAVFGHIAIQYSIVYIRCQHQFYFEFPIFTRAYIIVPKGFAAFGSIGILHKRRLES